MLAGISVIDCKLDWVGTVVNLFWMMLVLVDSTGLQIVLTSLTITSAEKTTFKIEFVFVLMTCIREVL